MLGKRSRPTTIKKPTGGIRPAGVVECATSPRSPLDHRILSPRSPKNYDQQGGVGLGIVVALDNNTSSNYYGGEILAKYALNGRFSCRSNPIPMNNSSTINYNKSECEEHEGLDDMLDEEFTYVTCHVPNKPKTTQVYYNGVAHGHVTRNGINQNLRVFTISSPATSSFDYTNSYSDFLSSCHLCKKTLHGKDIYMYRGDKAFCSEECRQSQICNEERKEQCKSEASRSTNVSISSYSYTTRGSRILSPGIMAL